VTPAGPILANAAIGWWLEWEQAGVRSRLPLDRPRWIGRDSTVDVRLRDATISRRHAVVAVVAGQIVVDASMSTNGVQLDRGRADRVALGPGQSFSIGGTIFRVMQAPTAQPSVSRPPVAYGQPGAVTPPAPPPAAAYRHLRDQRQNLFPFAVVGAICLVVVMVLGGAALLMGGGGANGGPPGTDSGDSLGIAPPLEQVSANWTSAPSVTDGVTVKYPSAWHADQSSDGGQVVLRQPDSPTDRPVPTISISFEPGVAVTQPPAIDGMSTPEPTTVAGLQGWEYHQVGLVAPSAATFIDLSYHGGRLQMAATRGPAVDLVPQLKEILKTLAVSP
jgi:hypothetical protein